MAEELIPAENQIGGLNDIIDIIGVVSISKENSDRGG